MLYGLILLPVVAAFSGSYCPMGVQTSTRIPDSAITGNFSNYSDVIANQGGRLYGSTVWDPKSFEPYLVISLGANTTITGVATQGGGLLSDFPGRNEAVSFQFGYSVDGTSWTPFSIMFTGVTLASTTEVMSCLIYIPTINSSLIVNFFFFTDPTNGKRSSSIAFVSARRFQPFGWVFRSQSILSWWSDESLRE